MAYLVRLTSDQNDKPPVDVRIISACWIHGTPRKIGDIVTVDHQDAIELRMMKRVEYVDSTK